MPWVPIQFKGTGNWRIALVPEGDWREGDYTDQPKASDIFVTQAEAEAEAEKRNFSPESDEDSN
jgi:hypothetical protein